MIKDVAYNTGGPISGTTQVNNIAIGTDNPDYTSGSWVGGVDDADGYVIVCDTTTLGLVGRTTGGGTGVATADTPTFWKSDGLTDQDLVDLINKLPGSNGNYTNVTEARNALAFSPYAIVNDYNGGGGEGSWYFYSDAGQLNAPPPTQDGNAIFLIRDTQTNTVTETFNPNKSNGANEIYLNFNDSAGTDYSSQFTALASNGGSITITQGANSVKYTSTTPAGVFIADSGAGFFFIQTGQAIQSLIAASPFVYGDPITLTFS